MQLPNQRILKAGKFLVIGVLLVVGSIVYLYPQLFYCETIGWSSFQKLSPRVFVSPEINKRYYPLIAKFLLRAEARVDSFYGEKVERPKLIVCSNQDQYKKYCNSLEGAGCSLGTPWGSSFIVVNAQDLTVDVVSHEMSHIALLGKLGWWKTTMEVPQWFNEGLALMLDRRFVESIDPVQRYMDYLDEWMYYTKGGQQILELENITSVKSFFGGNKTYVMLAYMTSGLEVSYWLQHSGDVSGLIKEMNAGESFKDAYDKVEKEGLKKGPKSKLPVNPLRRHSPVIVE